MDPADEGKHPRHRAGADYGGEDGEGCGEVGVRILFVPESTEGIEAGQMTAKAQYDKDGNLIPLILTPPNKYGYRVNVVDHEDGRRAYEEYRRERGHPLHFAESDEFRHAFEREYIARLFDELPPERRPALEARIGADYLIEIGKKA